MRETTLRARFGANFAGIISYAARRVNAHSGHDIWDGIADVVVCPGIEAALDAANEVIERCI